MVHSPVIKIFLTRKIIKMKSTQNNVTLSAAFMMRAIFAIPSIMESQYHYGWRGNAHDKQKGILTSSIFDFFSSAAQIYYDNKNRDDINRSVSIAKFLSSFIKVGFAFSAYLLSLNQDQNGDRDNREKIQWLNKAHEIMHWIHHALSATHFIKHAVDLVNYNTSHNRGSVFEETNRCMGLENEKKGSTKKIGMSATLP